VDSVAPLLAGEAAPGEQVLDMCCGHGNVVAALLARGARVVALDFSPEMIAQARARRRRGLPDGRCSEPAPRRRGFRCRALRLRPDACARPPRASYLLRQQSPESLASVRAAMAARVQANHAAPEGSFRVPCPVAIVRGRRPD